MIRAQRLIVRVSAVVLIGTAAFLSPTARIGADDARETLGWKIYSDAQAGFSFRYPKDWKVEDEGFYETAGGSKANVWSLILYRERVEEDSANWVRFNPRQFQEEDGSCAEVGGNQICTYSRDREVLEVYQKVVYSMKVKRADRACTPPPDSQEREEIIDALRREISGSLGQDTVVVVNYLKVQNGWAWIEASPQSGDGANFYEDASGLLLQEQGQWIVRHLRPCCGECADDPDCNDNVRYFSKLRASQPSAPAGIFPGD